MALLTVCLLSVATFVALSVATVRIYDKICGKGEKDTGFAFIDAKDHLYDDDGSEYGCEVCSLQASK